MRPHSPEIVPSSSTAPVVPVSPAVVPVPSALVLVSVPVLELVDVPVVPASLVPVVSVPVLELVPPVSLPSPSVVPSVLPVTGSPVVPLEVVDPLDVGESPLVVGAVWPEVCVLPVPPVPELPVVPSVVVSAGLLPHASALARSSAAGVREGYVVRIGMAPATVPATRARHQPIID